jgi:ribonuclease PH
LVAVRSALFEMGNTKVIAAVYGPHEVRVKLLIKIFANSFCSIGAFS